MERREFLKKASVGAVIVGSGAVAFSAQSIVKENLSPSREFEGGFTYRGVQVTDLLMKYAPVDDARERNRQFIDALCGRVGHVPECEWSYMFAIMSGMGFALSQGE